MPGTKQRYKRWIVGPPASSFEKHFYTHRHHTKYISEFETDVTTNPFRHQTRGKIVPIQQERSRYPKGSYRWRKSDLRVVYFPKKDDHTVYPLDAGTAGSIPYKKRS